MRILDEVTNRSCERIICYLTPAEAKDLRDSLDALLTGPADQHQHVSSEDYAKEITVCIYTLDNLSHFDPRSRLLIEEDR